MLARAGVSYRVPRGGPDAGATRHGNRRRRGLTYPRVLVYDPDPYLLFLVRAEFPEARAIPADDREFVGLLAKRIDVVVADLERPATVGFLTRQPGLAVVAVADSRRAADTLGGTALAGLILRPFAPAELYEAIWTASPRNRQLRWTAGPTPQGVPEDRQDRVFAWLLAARLTTLGLAAALEFSGTNTSAGRALALGLFIYVILTSLLRPRTMAWASLDLAAATLALPFTGGFQSPLAPFGLVAATATAYSWPSWLGPLVGVLPAGAAALWPAVSGQSGRVSPQVVLWFGLFPLASLVGTTLVRDKRRSAPGSDLGEEANRVLAALVRIARAVPGGFDLTAVAEAALEEVGESLRCPAGVVLLREVGLVRALGRFGTQGDVATTFAVDEFPPSLFGPQQTTTSGQWATAARLGLSGYRAWVATPLRREGHCLGTLVTAWWDGIPSESALLTIECLAAETSMALENAALFRRVQELAATEERQRLGGELHDGMAQALVHLRYELEGLARRSPSQGTISEEAARLARVAEGALFDMRSTIQGLRRAPDGGLVAAFGDYLRDLRSLGGPTLEFLAVGDTRFSPEFEAQVFRIGQEAVSNALRHAIAGSIVVTLQLEPAQILLRVQDDGVGLAAASVGQPGSGVGLQSMRERARQLGGRLVVGDAEGGGTCVELAVEAPSPSDVTMVRLAAHIQEPSA